MSTMTAYLTSNVVRKDGSVRLKKFDGTPQRQWERLAAHFLLVFSWTCIAVGLYLLATSNLGPTEEPTPPQQPTIQQPAEQPALQA